MRWTLILLFLMLSPALAHDKLRPELNPWLESLHSRSHSLCCDDKDKNDVDDIDWGTQDKDYDPVVGGQPIQKTHFWVNIEGQRVDVPDSAIVDGPNLEGHALVWYYPQWREGVRIYVVRCFMPGTMG